MSNWTKRNTEMSISLNKLCGEIPETVSDDDSISVKVSDIFAWAKEVATLNLQLHSLAEVVNYYERSDERDNEIIDDNAGALLMLRDQIDGLKLTIIDMQDKLDIIEKNLNKED